MNDDDLKLLKKFENSFNSTINESKAIELLANLSINEYERIIDLLENNHFSTFSDDTKQKALIFLRSLKNKVNKD